jgi:hypothetical protein
VAKGERAMDHGGEGFARLNAYFDSTKLTWVHETGLDFSSGRHLFLLRYDVHSNLFKRIRRGELQSYWKKLWASVKWGSHVF